MKTLYELLGVSPDAGDEAIKTAYRKLAKMHHPDHHPNDPDAAHRFRQVAAAVAVLCDANRRAAYNQRLVRELLRRLDRERERRRWQWLRMVAISGAAAAVTAVVVAKAPDLAGPVSPKSVVASLTARNIEQQTVGIAAAPREGARHERSNDEIRSRPAIVLSALTSPDDAKHSVQPEHYCKDERASGLSRAESVPAGLSANQRAALIRQAQELVASGDTRTARVMMERACQNSSRCGPNSRADL
jgi:DnaJ-class molecular chaperone